MFIAGIVLLGVIALGLALFFYVVKRRQAREVERLQQQREARRRRAAERRAREALEAEQRAAAIPIKSVVPGALGGGRLKLAGVQDVQDVAPAARLRQLVGLLLRTAATPFSPAWPADKQHPTASCATSLC